jgi:uncharacterized protein (TIGR03790 family)
VRFLTSLTIFLAVLWSHETAAAAPSLASKTLVVYNINDPDSAQLARYYAARRKIPDEQVLGLKCATESEEISRDEYDTTIAEPLRRAFDTNRWWEVSDNRLTPSAVIKNSIRFVALIRGMPLKVREKTSYEGDKPDRTTVYGPVNGCSVDSEIAVLGKLTRQISGPMKNPYYQHYDRFDSVELPQYMLVCRLDGPTPDDVKRMIDQSLRAEASGLWGWVLIDQRGTSLPGYKAGDDWMKSASTDFRKRGFPVFGDYTEAILPSGLPLPRTAFYLGWYSESLAGAFASPGVQFLPGAVACHLHSASASTLRSTTQGWCGPLISRGVDAVMGNVYEPYLALTSNFDIFSERLLRGYTFAEAAWASLRATSWMNVVVGDPLYSPFALLADAEPGFTGELAAFHRSAKNDLVDASTGVTSEAWAHRRLAEGDEAGAEFLFQQALKKHKDGDSRARVAWSYSEWLLQKDRKDAALAILKETEAKMRGEKAAAFLSARLLQLDPPKPGTTPPAPAK